MGTEKSVTGQKRDSSGANSAPGLSPGAIPSDARQDRPRLVLKFMSAEEPELERIEFHANKSPKHEYRQHGDALDKTRRFKSAQVTRALPIFFLDYLCARLKTPPKSYLLEGGDGSLAATLGYAINDLNGKWGRLFVEFRPDGGKSNRVEKIFGGKNWGGKPAKHRIIFVKQDYLPPECVEIFWHERQLKRLEDIQKLTGKFRKVWKLPPPVELDLPEGEGSDEKETSPVETPPEKTETPPTAPEAPAKQLPPGKLNEKPPKTATEVFTPPDKPPPKEPELPLKLKVEPTPDLKIGNLIIEFKRPEKEEPVLPPEPPPVKIDPRLFEIQNPDGLEWDDSDPLLNFGTADSSADIWKIRDANEGVLIFGAVGSGKTSGSGSAVATALLRAGYGGLVLTAKTDEAQRWLRLCERTGRAGDCIHVTPRSGHKLNVLQYEVQRPGDRISVADDLVALLRCINAVVSRSKQNEEGDKFWTLAPNKLMKNLFEIFWISGEPFTINNFTRFINRAPTERGQPWKGREFFSEILIKAEANAKKGSDEDKRMFPQAFEYWTKTFPAVPDITRGGVVASFDSMSEILNGRGIYEMLCMETNLTPEMILSGKVVILDFPVKESSQGGLMVQATWKLLVEQAIERRADKNQPTARPVFLWEDEGHEFFSQHDVRFQPTARDCRACHVIMSQNLHNFFHLGHGRDAVEAVFAAMNTHIFHTNGDHDTNSWASQKIGEVKKKHWTTGGLIKGFTDDDHKIVFRDRPGETKSIGKLDITEDKEPGMRPEDFSKLKRGGDGTCEAVILWLGHEFAVNNKMNFCKRKFQQEKRPTDK
jgi:hypothetical protein